MPTAQVNGITIHYRLEGATGDLVVLVNGLADDLATWDAQVPALLGAGYRVLRYDNRGIGLSSRPPGPYTADMMAADLHALLVHLLNPGATTTESATGPSTTAFHLLGVSMGGMIAQAYALNFPNGSAASAGLSLRSLALCCTYAAPTAFCARMFAWWADVATQMGVRAVMRDVALWAFTVPFFRSRDEDLRRFDADMDALVLSPVDYLAQLNVIRAFDSTAALDGLKAAGRPLGLLADPRRVLVLAGKTDILIPVVLSRELADRVEGSQFLTCKGGHACLWEFPDDFNRTILQFLDEFRADRS